MASNLGEEEENPARNPNQLGAAFHITDAHRVNKKRKRWEDSGAGMGGGFWPARWRKLSSPHAFVSLNQSRAGELSGIFEATALSGWCLLLLLRGIRPLC